MVRRGSQRAKKAVNHHPNSAPAQPGAVTVATSVPALSYGTSVAPSPGNSQQGLKSCPQCQTVFNSTNCRPVQEACGHWKCRTCMIANEDGCPQCRQIGQPHSGGSLQSVSSGTTRRTLPGRGSNLDDIDLMPPVLIEEEPIASSSSGDKVLRNMGQLHETPPKLSSAAMSIASQSKLPVKRKQKEVSPSAPSKILKTSLGASTLQQKKSDPRERPKMGTRRSSTSSAQSISPKPPSRTYRQGTGDILAEDESQRRSVRVSVNNRKSTSTTPVNQANMPVVVVTQSLAQGKEKARSATSALSRAKLPFSNQSRDDSGPSFAVTISPTTIPVKSSGSGSLLTKPILSPAKAVTEGSDDLGFSITSVSSGATVVMPSSSNSNDESNSNSLETCDPLDISNDWNANDSNSAASEGQQGQQEVKKKKKRSPVTIHEHITILSGDPLLYQCNVCMKKFKTKAHIKYHEFCQNGEKPYKCEECGQGFIAKSHYEYHLRTHTGERPYVCPKCGKGFNQRGKVTRHMRSHTGEKPFICQQCGRGFANAQALRSHFLIHTGERPFACQYCNKRFTGMTNLKKHVITHTGERPFTCNHCGKSFGLKWTLDLHLRTHSTERPFQCDQCTRAFSNSKDLRRHLVIHSGERPFKCWICGTAFRRKDNLDRHIKNTHNQPKEVAKQLANEAAAEYMAQTKANQVVAAAAARAAAASAGNTDVPKPSSSKKSATNAAPSKDGSDSRDSPAILRNAKEKKKKTSENVDVIITADLSPPTSPPVASEAETVGGNNMLTANGSQNSGNVYVIPNGQPSIPSTAVITTDVNSGTVEAHFVEVREFDGLAELRTVPVNEYHQLEGIKLLEKAKSSGDPSDKEEEVSSQPVVEEEVKDVKHRLEETGDVLFCGAPGTTDGGRNFSQGLTVTVVYENDGKTHFITDQPSQYPGTVDPLSFPTDQSTGLMAIPRETLFSFPTTTVVNTGEENSQDDSSSQPRTSEIHLKKSETILSGNLSKYLQMDLPKTVCTRSENSDEVTSSEYHNQMGVENDKGDSVYNDTSGQSSQAYSEHVNEAFSSYQVKSEIDIEYGTNEIDEEVPMDEEVTNADAVESSLSSVSETSGKKSGETIDKDIGNRSDIEVDPLKTRSIKIEAKSQIRRPESELEEGEIERDGLDNNTVVGNEEATEPRSSSESSKSPPKDAVDSVAQDNYPSDPMFQDPYADDEEKLQQQQMEDSKTQNTAAVTTTAKSTEDSVLPDGLDGYGSPEAIFEDNIVRSSRWKDEGRCFRGIVDKECPASILQDETSNCGSMDPISDDDEDFSESFNGPESPLEAGEIPRRRLRESIDVECPEQILQPTNDYSCGGSQEPSVLKQNAIDALRRFDSHSHDNDTESISSTELEPLPEDESVRSGQLQPTLVTAKAVDDEGSDNNNEAVGEAFNEFPNPALEKKGFPHAHSVDVGVSKIQSSAVLGEVAPAPSDITEQSCSGQTSYPIITLTNKQVEGDTASSSSVDGPVQSMMKNRDGARDSTFQIENTKTDLVKKPMDNTDLSAGDDELKIASIGEEFILSLHHSSDFDSSETEPISDEELEDDDQAKMGTRKIGSSEIASLSKGMSSSGDFKRNKRKRDDGEDAFSQHVKTKIVEVSDAEKLIAALESPVKVDVAASSHIPGPKNAISPTAATRSIQEAKFIINKMCSEELSTNTSSCERTESETISANTKDIKVTAVEETKQDVEEGLTLTSDEIKECGREERELFYAVPCESPKSDVETVEKSTQCVQTEDDDNGDDEPVEGNSRAESPSVEDSTTEQQILVSNVRSLGGYTSPVSPVAAPLTMPAYDSETANESMEISSEPVVIKTEHGIPAIATIIEKIQDTAVGYELSQHHASIPEKGASPIGNTHPVEMISPEPATVAYVAIPETVTVPSQARLIYANPLVTTGAPAVLLAQPVNLSQSTATTSSYGTAATASAQPADMVVSNYRIVYAPEVATTSGVSAYSNAQPSFRFIYENGEPVLTTESTEPMDNKMRIVYACAAATADPPGNCGPQKLKLLYAEALGVGTPDESGQVQLVYTSTAPNQNIVHAPNQNVRIYSPTFLTADTSANSKNIEMLFAQQPEVEPSAGPVPVEVLYNGNGTVMAQTVGQPQDLSWIRRDLNHSFIPTSPSSAVPQQSSSSTAGNHCASTTTTSYSSTNARLSTNLASTREIVNHHNYASSPYINADKRSRYAMPYEQQQQAQGESDGLRTLARAAATRMFTIQADADATTRAAAAIAAVGREAQIKRQMDMIERNKNLPGTQTVFIRKGENVPHRGPRKHYLSQLTNSRK